MAVKGILFNTDNVRAILDGRKTVTRRVIRPYTKGGKILNEKPPCKPGDILYVRETWTKGTDIWDCQRTSPEYFYKADYLDAAKEFGRKVKWHPSIHMPKEAARIWLEVKAVRVERLRDITEEGARQEGFKDDIEYTVGHPARYHFAYGWDSTIKKQDLPLYGWDANPWVWVIEFERTVKPNESSSDGAQDRE